MNYEIIAAEMILNGKELSGCRYIIEHGLELESVRDLVHKHCPNPRAMDYFIDRAWKFVTS